jgi:ASC-1-like (ASCH) protein
MTHYSVVSPVVFASIQAGHRVIEPRLNDAAHRAIRPGDLIVITNRETEEQVVTKVVGILRYPSFMELVQAYPADRFGVYDERDILAEMRRYYTADQELEHGVVGIKLHRLSNKT